MFKHWQSRPQSHEEKGLDFYRITINTLKIKKNISDTDHNKPNHFHQYWSFYEAAIWINYLGLSRGKKKKEEKKTVKENRKHRHE